ncbi:hypothetical protein SAMN05446589_2016 [Streptomyces sp. OV198]|nr:hypothetical protein BX281_3425 [Streptomyces sp. Ag82_O1-15]SOE61928.1 hypothetical protein SAMN05446589_2016 [Streptomyces sp. OV198]
MVSLGSVAPDPMRGTYATSWTPRSSRGGRGMSERAVRSNAETTSPRGTGTALSPLSRVRSPGFRCRSET